MARLCAGVELGIDIGDAHSFSLLHRSSALISCSKKGVRLQFHAIMLIALLLVLAMPLRADQDFCRQASEALARKDLSLAEPLLKKCIKTPSAPADAYSRLCAIYQEQGRKEDLYAVARAGLSRFPGEKRFYVAVGLHDAREGRYASAIRILVEAARRWPDDPRLRDYLGDAYLESGLADLDAGRDVAAVEALRKAVGLKPGEAEAHLNLGRALHNLRRSPEAVAEFDSVIRIQPDLPLAHFHRGMVLVSLAEYSRAVADLDREIEINPEYPPSYLFRGEARMGLDDWAGALRDLEIAVQRMPDTFRAFYSLGKCLSSLDRRQEAEAAYRTAMKLNPSDTRTIIALAQLLQRAGRSEEAGPLFKKASDLMNEHRPIGPVPSPKPKQP